MGEVAGYGEYVLFGAEDWRGLRIEMAIRVIFLDGFTDEDGFEAEGVVIA
jgi:hypothetical protein